MDTMLLPTGLAVGFLVGLTGVGGGALMTPALILYGVPPAVAVGTDLVYAAMTKSTGVLLHQLRGNIDWSIVALMSSGSLPAASCMVWLLSTLSARDIDYTPIVTSVLGATLVLTGVVVLLRPALARLGADRHAPRPRWVTVLGGAGIGSLVAASSVGAGALGAALLMVLHQSLPVRRVVGTDLAHALLLAVVAGIGHWRLGAVDSGILILLLAGSLPGVYLGARLAGKLPESFLAPAMALLLTLLGVGISIGAEMH